jgi:hypothetical protein
MTGQRIAGGLAVAFGLLTVVSGGTALFGAVDMGAVVPFVLWFNFVAGLAYIAGGILLWRGHTLAFPVALAILFATAAVFAAFLWRVAAGGAFEMRTLGAMTLRTAFWAAMAWVAWRRRGHRSEEGRG